MRMAKTMSFLFQEREPVRWSGRYRRIPGRQPVLHVRRDNSIDIVWEGGDAPGHSPDKMTGGKIKDEWVKFSKDSGSLGIPREKMPQFDEADTGELMEYLKGKGIEGRRASASPDDLKPTQAEYSSAKVDRIASGMFGKNERPIMVSSDGYVLDRHHQLMAARQNGEEKVPVIVFNKPIRELMAAVEQFPKAYKTEEIGRAHV